MARVDAKTHRGMRNVGEGDAILVIVGGKDGYVGRDGQAVGADPRGADPRAPLPRVDGRTAAARPARRRRRLGPSAGGDWDRAEAVALDRPGWDGDSRASDLAGNCRAALSALDDHGFERAIVVGHSFGAAVGAWLAVHHPNRVEELVLVAPAANRASLYEVDRWLAAPVVGYLASAVALSGAGAALTAAPLRRRIARGLAIDDRYLSRAGRRLLTPPLGGRSSTSSVR